MKNRNMIGSFLLLITAIIWGCAFVAQRVGMDYVGPFTFQSVRSFIGGIVLLPVIVLFKRKTNAVSGCRNASAVERKSLITGGLLCGTVLCVASCLQQFGIARTTVGKAGFLTALYILIVPVAGILLGKKIRLVLWACIAGAAAGLYLLCMSESFSISAGDSYVILCSFFFSAHIMLVDHYSTRVDCVKLSCIQFFVSGVLSGIPMMLIEHPSIAAVLSAWLPLLYAGILSCGVAYTLQIIGQKHTAPTVASLLMSLESVFAVVAGIVILKQMPSLREAAGCALMFCAIVIAQLPKRQAKEPDARILSESAADESITLHDAET